MRRGGDKREIRRLSEWTEEKLVQEARRLWPDLQEFTLRYGSAMAFHLVPGLTVWVSESGDRTPTALSIILKYRQLRWGGPVSVKATAEDLIALARDQWNIPREIELIIEEKDGRMEVHLGAEYTVAEVRPGCPAGFVEVPVIHGDSRTVMRIGRSAEERAFKDILEMRLKLKKGCYVVRYGDSEEFDLSKEVRVESGVYTFRVQRGSAQMTVLGCPTTTADDVKQQALAHWGLEEDDWELRWGDGPFVVRDKMNTELVPRHGDEMVEITLVAESEERPARVHSEADLTEMSDTIRQAFGLAPTTKCRVKRRDRTGPYIQRERVEVEIKKRRRCATQERAVRVSWGEQTRGIEIPQAQMSKSAVERIIEAQWPELMDVRHAFVYEENQGGYWTEDTPITIRELQEGELARKPVGRPRKTNDAISRGGPRSSSAEPKRPVGRPRKTAEEGRTTEDEQPDRPKRGRGRPPKQPREARIIIIIIHLLGLAPAGYLAAPDNGPRGPLRVVHAKYLSGESVDSLCH
jgi:hypothetical protein